MNEFKVFKEFTRDTSYLEDSRNTIKKGDRKIKAAAEFLLIGSVLLGSTNIVCANQNHYKISDKATYSYESIKDEELIYEEYFSELKNLDGKNFTKKEIIEKVLSFKSLEDSWDGYGAIPLEIQASSNALSLIDSIGDELSCKLYDIYPNPHGTITLEWENIDNECLVLEIGNKTFSYYLELNSVETLYRSKLLLTNENIKLLKNHIKSV